MMMATTVTQQKTLFVGRERICQQIAYVLDIQDYACTEKLTKQNFEQYRDYQIYVCEFKRKSRKLVKVSNQVKLQYLDDICRTIDEEYYSNRKRYAVASNTTTKSVVVPTTVTAVPANEDQPIKSLWRRIRRGMKHPLRAAWHVVLRTKERLKRQTVIAKRQRQTVQKRQAELKRQKQIQRQIRKGNLHHLRRLKPSALLIYVLQAPVNKQIQCDRLETFMRVDPDGDVKGCCSVVVSFGNLHNDGELNEIYNSKYARIVKLSSLNRSYCLCNFNTWCKGYCSNDKPLQPKEWEPIAIPRRISLSFDRSCNLCCKSCRIEPYVMDQESQQHANEITSKLLRSGFLDQTQALTVAGMGEAFYSPYYRQLLATNLQRQQITILSNGTLFNEDNWRLLAGKYTTIDVSISVDAATAETYQKLRGADFNQLMKNLTMLADLHRRKQIRKFGLYFVMQRDNFREMPAFVQLGKSLGADYIEFQRMNNLGTFTRQEFHDQCLIVDNRYLDYELWCIMQDPIFKDPIVNFQGFKRYLDASEHCYRKRYEQEQSQHHSV